MQKVGDHTLIGASGDISDFQAVMSMVDEMQTLDMARDDGCSMTPRDFHQYLGRVMYNRCPCLLRAARCCGACSLRVSECSYGANGRR